MQQASPFLHALNEAQLKAATHPATSSLQILAGPGSGKTRVLTARIAHLILNCHIPPQAICAVTFTNKAANEMRERLKKLLGKESILQLKMGTFHSLCARFLRKYAKAVSIPENFTVCDASESKRIIAASLKVYEKDLNEHNLTLEPGVVASMISKAKSKGQSAEDFLVSAKAEATRRGPGVAGTSVPIYLDVILGEIYVSYEGTLRNNGALDFDDLLVYGVKLFSGHLATVSWCQHILVDEFQDTNVTQYAIMRAIADPKKCITIVGDPDQSIYGWRAAEVENLAKMQRDFPNTVQIFLEENYRSTGAILKLSLEIVSQDAKRISKSLYTTHPDGIQPILYQVYKEQDEAAFIAIEIKRLVASMGGVFNWGDFAILLRYNALSRNLESALQKEGIPCRILGGHRFFERLEVKDILAHLQLIDNPAYVPAFLRIVNVPGRGIGEKTLSDILQRAEKSKKSPVQLLEDIYDAKLSDSKPTIRKKISSFVQVMRKLRKFAETGMGPSDLIHQLLDVVQYREHLRKTQPDWETRWENVKELITFAKEVEQNLKESATPTTPQEYLDVEPSPLRQFLQVSMLSSAGDNDNEDSQNKVTISTCHSAKGLEWPVVMIPSVDASTFPFIRSEDEDEERRLLYVACTRAKALLYLTRSTSRMVAGHQKKRELSKFINQILTERRSESKSPLLIQRIPQLELEDRAIICKVLERSEPDETEVEQKVDAFLRLGREHPPPIIWRPLSQSFEFDSFPSSAQPSLTIPVLLPTFGRPDTLRSTREGLTPSAMSTPYGQYQAPECGPFVIRQPVIRPLSKVATSSAMPTNTQVQVPLRNQFALLMGHSRSSPLDLYPDQTKQGIKPIVYPPTIKTGIHPEARQYDLTHSVPKGLVLRPGGNRGYIQPPLHAPIAPAVNTPANDGGPPMAKPSTTPAPIHCNASLSAAVSQGGVKRRLGMAPRSAGGYANKKFKPPTL